MIYLVSGQNQKLLHPSPFFLKKSDNYLIIEG